MDILDPRRDPCADAIARIPVIDAFEAVDAEVTTDAEGIPIATFAPGRERPIKYMQHPAYRRFLRGDTLAA